MSAESLDILKNQSRRARRASNVKTIMLHVHSRIVSSMLPYQVILVAGIHKTWKPAISFVMYLKEAGDIHVCAACQRQIDLLLVERFYCSLTTFLASKWPQIWHDLSFVQLRDWSLANFSTGSWCAALSLSSLSCFLQVLWQGVNRKSPALLVCRDGLRTDLHLLELLDWWSHECTVLLSLVVL